MSKRLTPRAFWQSTAACARPLRLGTLAIASLCIGAALAQPQPPPHPRKQPPGAAPHWRGDIRRFHEHDWQLWRGGRWHHGAHAGRLGWWWIVGGAWYFYPAPVYPYPNPWEPPPVDPDTATSGSPPPPPTQYWYYCESAQRYYPYVPSCPGGWKQVPATPPK